MLSGETKVRLLLLLDSVVPVRVEKLARQCSEKWLYLVPFNMHAKRVGKSKRSFPKEAFWMFCDLMIIILTAIINITPSQVK